MKRNGPKAGMMESPQIAAECVQMAAASSAVKPREMKQELRQFPQTSPGQGKQEKRNAQEQAIQNCQPACTSYCVCLCVYVCTGKRRNEQISLSPPSYFASLSLLRCSSTDIEIVNVWRSVKHFPQSRVCCLINSASQPPSSVRLSRPDFALHMQLINAMHKLTSEQNQIHSTRLQLM